MVVFVLAWQNELHVGFRPLSSSNKTAGRGGPLQLAAFPESGGGTEGRKSQLTKFNPISAETLAATLARRSAPRYRMSLTE